MENEITNIGFLINNYLRHETTAKKLFMVDECMGREVVEATAARSFGCLSIYFASDQGLIKRERESTVLNMKGVNSFDLHVDISDFGQTPSLEGFAVVDNE